MKLWGYDWAHTITEKGFDFVLLPMFLLLNMQLLCHIMDPWHLTLKMDCHDASYWR